MAYSGASDIEYVVQGAYLSAFRFFESRDIECEFNDDVCEDTMSENQTSEEKVQPAEAPNREPPRCI